MKMFRALPALAMVMLPLLGIAQTKKAKATGDAIKSPQLSPLPAEQRLIELKKNFPAQKKTRVPGGSAGTIEIEIPSNEIYSDYHGSVSVITLDSLPKVIAQLEAKIPVDIDSLKKRAESTPGAEKKKLNSSATWLASEFRPYLAKLKALAGQR